MVSFSVTVFQGDEMSLSSLLNQLVSPAKSTASSRYTDFKLPFDVNNITKPFVYFWGKHASVYISTFCFSVLEI